MGGDDDSGKGQGRSTRAERENRLIDGEIATREDPKTVLYQHTVFCQTGLPYRNPGDDVRTWERVNGHIHLQVSAGSVLDPQLNRFVPVGLPYGPKPRLLLAHLNAEALRYRCREIEVERTLTGFVKALGFSTDGRTINTIKDQLARLAASRILLGVVRGTEAITINSQIVSAFHVWSPKEDGQQVLSPSTIILSTDYFDSLTKHAVPLHHRALASLSGSAMALDVYAWLAQRLHRIERGQRAFIAWSALKAQFGVDHARMDHFKEAFRRTLNTVHSQYRAANVELDGQGMTLRHSPPPVKGRTGIVVRLP